MTAVDVRFAQGAPGGQPWPVETELTQPLTDAQLRATPVEVDDGHPDPQTNALTDAQLRAAAVLVSADELTAIRADLDNRFISGKRSYGGVLGTSGDNVVITPASGKRVAVYWVAFVPNSDNSAANLVTVKFATSNINMYVGYAMAHAEQFLGVVDEPVTVTLANSQPVAVTIHYREID